MAGEPLEILSSVEEGERCQSNIPIRKWGDTAFLCVRHMAEAYLARRLSIFHNWSGDKIELSLESK